MVDFPPADNPQAGILTTAFPPMLRPDFGPSDSDNQ